MAARLSSVVRCVYWRETAALSSLAAILSERKDRTKLGVSKSTAEAAEQAAEHRDKLGIAGKMKDVAGVHKTLWPEEANNPNILQIGFLIGTANPFKEKPVE